MTALKGNYLAVGSRFEDGGAINSGAAYVFERNSQNVWSQVARLIPPHADQDDVFGHTVRLSGNTLVVAPKWDDADAT